MAENLEKEKIARIESFRMEIKGVVEALEKRKGKDETARGIKEFAQLDEDDFNLWQEYKNILVVIDSLNVKNGKDAIQEELQVVRDRAMLLAKNTEVMMSDVKNKDKESKKTFGGWLNNRNPAQHILNAQRRFDANGFTKAVKKLKEQLTGSIDFYANAGWKNQEIET
jgi:hypothetical protein